MRCPRCAGVGEVPEPAPYVARQLDIVEPEPEAPKLVSSVRVVSHGPTHEEVHVWNRGGFSGALIVSAGDGEKLAELLRGES